MGCGHLHNMKIVTWTMLGMCSIPGCLSLALSQGKGFDSEFTTEIANNFEVTGARTQCLNEMFHPSP